MSHLALSLLGAFEATLDGAPIPFSSVKARALLAYLAVESGRPHPREILASLLWPEEPEAVAHNNFRHTLSALRKAVGDRDETENPVLLVTRETVQLNCTSDCWLDVRAFQERGTTANPGPQLAEAVILYRGDFLEGFYVKNSAAFEDWALLIRDRLQRQAATALQRLVEIHEGQGDYEHACAYAWRWIELEPWQEDAYQHLMRVLALNGQRTTALAQYDVCRDILQEEFGVEPSAQTLRLYERIRDGEIHPPIQPTSGTQAAPLLPASPVLPHPSVSIALPALESERRVVTLLLADVNGPAMLLQRRHTEAWAEFITPALHLLGAEIARFGGTVEQYRCAGLTACFGGRVAHEDDPERALLATLAMQEALTPYLTENDAADLCLTISVHTGEVIFAAIGDTASLMGDVFDNAERIQVALEPGTIWVSPETYRMIAPLFTWMPREGAGHQPLAHHPQVDKGRGIAGLSSPLVGREAELRALQEAVERLQAGMGGIVTLIGEAGIGKSRLVAELKRSAVSHQPSAGLAWVEGRCLSYAINIAYQVWRDMLHAWLDDASDATLDAVTTVLRQRISAVCPGTFDDVYPFLVWLLSLPLDDTAATRLRGIDAEGLQVLTFRAMETLLGYAAQQAPLVIVCEDLHWADTTSLALLEHLLALTDRAPLLFVCIFRPEHDHGCWHIREVAARTYEHHHTDIRLRALSADDSTQLVSNLLAMGALPKKLCVHILERAEGNPFYVEEIVRSLIDDGIIAYDEAIGQWSMTREMDAHTLPDTLYGVLMARMDRLPAGAKRVLQLASVVGHSFTYPLLSAIAESSALEAHLVTLQRAQMIHERTRVLEQNFIFHHQFTLEVAYSGLLRRARHIMHRRVAEALETLYPERIEENLGLLAHHWEQAENIERAVMYLRRAGEQAAARYANAEALDYVNRALELTSKLDIAERYALLSARARVYDLQGWWEIQGQDLTALIELAAALDESAPQPHKSRQAQVAVQQAKRANRTKQLTEAISAAQTAIHLAQAVQDTASEAAGYREWGRALWRQGSTTISLIQLERALALARKAQLHQVEIDTLHSIGLFYLRTDPDKAQSYYEQGLYICQETGNRRDESEAERDLGWALQTRGKPEQAVPHLEQSLQLCHTTGDLRNEGWTLLMLGENHLQQDHYTEGQAYCEQALVIFNEINEPFGKARTLAVLYNAALEHEQPEKALHYDEQALQHSREEGDRTREGYLLERTGFFWSGQGSYSVAQNCLEQALNITRETGNHEDEVWALLDLGRLYFCLGDYNRAQVLTEKGLHIARTEFSGGVFRALIVLCLISHCRDDNEMAQQYGEQALLNAQEAKSTVRQSLAWRILGDTAAGLCHWNEATQAYIKSLELWQREEIHYFGRRSRHDLATESRAGLARVALAQGDAASALTHVEMILLYLKDHPVLPYAFEPLRVYLTCYQVLQANTHPCPQNILNRAYTMLQERAANIEDTALRRSYLENVPAHREIVAEFEKTHQEK